MCPVARHRGDNPVGAHFADALVIRIRNEQVAGGVHRHARGINQFSIGRRASVAGVVRSVPLPATVVIIPLVPTLRMRLLHVSAMNRLPVASTATPEGPFNSALVAAPPSPE